ncbi:MAG: PilZ domain-containing protein [Rhodospirillales bacterium]|jgi:hypothetical protein|nr:PilZ domain-containing protein [Rhodospirillales bacterium]
MSETGSGRDRRLHPRVEIQRDVDVRDDQNVIDGVVLDISAGGISIRSDADLEPGQEIVLDIDGMSDVAGKVLRATDNGFVVSLHLSPNAQDVFIADVMRIQNDIGLDEA